MKPEQLAHDFMTNQTGQEGGQVTIDWYAFRNALSRALLEAEQRGRRQGMEDASKAVQDELENLTSHDPGVCLDMVLRALQAKLDEVQK